MGGPSLLALLARGYFPRELPPPFTTASLATQIDQHAAALPAEYAGSQPSSRPVRHHLVRPGNLPRRFSIPNPTAAVAVARIVADNWGDLEAKHRQSHLSLSRPRFSATTSPRARALAWSFPQREQEARRAETRATARYIARADVSLFYPSIYTHSIPWALHGKVYAKQNQGPGILGNDLDRAIQRGQHNQTVGIPIGPDWSLAISELVLSDVDARLQDRFPHLQGMRRIDDYEFGCESQEDAEEVLAHLRASLAEYELQLNSGKTHIAAAPDHLTLDWLSDLRDFQLRESVRGQHDDLLTYFDLAARHARNSSTAAPLKFAAGRMRYLQLRFQNWPLLQYLLMQAALAEPDCIRNAGIALHIHSQRGLPIDRQKLQELLSLLISRHSRRGGSSEVAWAIWTALVFGIEIPDAAVEDLGSTADPIVALLALDAQARGFVKTLDTTSWLAALTKDDLRTEQWLLSYEAAVQGWLGTPAHVHQHPEFDVLEQWDVRFYDSERWLNPPVPVRPAPPEPRPDAELGGSVEEPEESEEREYPF